MAEADLPVETEPLEESARKAYLLGVLSKLERLLDVADDIYESWPKEVREDIEEKVKLDPPFGPTIRMTISLALAQGTPQTRDEIRRMFLHLGLEIQGEGDAIFRPDDLEFLNEIVCFTQVLRRNSRRQLHKFLDGVVNKERGMMLIVCDGKEVEVSHRYAAPDEVMKYFAN